MANKRIGMIDDQWIINYEAVKLNDKNEYWTKRVNDGPILVGDPAATNTKTIQQLTEMGLVGLYFPRKA